jgi:hypothetical protein
VAPTETSDVDIVFVLATLLGFGLLAVIGKAAEKL